MGKRECRLIVAMDTPRRRGDLFSLQGYALHSTGHNRLGLRSMPPVFPLDGLSLSASNPQHMPDLTPLDEVIQRLETEWGRAQLHRAPLRAYIADPSRAQRLLDRELQQLDALDDACKRWASGSGLPGLREEDGYLLLGRFEQALVFARWIRGRAEFHDRSSAEISTFFLVDFWRQYGRVIWGMQMKDHARQSA